MRKIFSKIKKTLTFRQQRNIKKIQEQISRGENAEALKLARKNVSGAIVLFDSLYLLGYLCQQLGMPEEGIRSLEKAVQKNNRNAEVLFRLALCKAQVNQWHQVADLILKISKIDHAFYSQQVVPLHARARAEIFLAGDSSGQEELLDRTFDVLDPITWANEKGLRSAVLSKATDIVGRAPRRMVGFSSTNIIGQTKGLSCEMIVLKDVLVHPKSDFIIAGKNIALNAYLPTIYGARLSYEYDSQVMAHNKNKAIFTIKPIAGSIEVDRGYFCGGLTCGAYGHWIYEYLPRIILGLPHIPADVPLLISGEMPSTHRQSLDCIAADREQSILPKNEWTRVKELTLVTPFSFAPPSLKAGLTLTFDDGPMHPIILPTLKKLRVLAPQNLRKRRLFLGRKKSTWRKLLNQQEVLAIVQHRGFENIFLEDYSFEQMLKIMGEAEAVIGPSGSAMNNVVFCGEGTKVFILSPPALENYTSWVTSLEDNGLAPSVIFGSVDLGQENQKHADFSIDATALSQELASILS